VIPHPKRFVRHWNSAFSRGVGYEPHLRSPFFDVGDVRGNVIDFSPKTRSPSAQHPEALLPAGLAQLALGWWERLLAGDPTAGGEFDRTCELLARRGVMIGESLVWHHDVRDHKYGIEPPWISALAQGEAGAVFARAYIRSGDDEHARLARSAIRPLLGTAGPTVVAHTEHGPALEECPSEPPSLILNGWVYALCGLRDVAVALSDGEAEGMLNTSTATLRMTLPRYDVGWWTRYSLYPHTLPDLAKPFYHRLHIELMDMLHELTGHDEFRAYATRWRRYDTALRRGAAISQKALFVATGYR
jgi:heparosan-N-sulfate-glucuronate 5-epimerase